VDSLRYYPGAVPENPDDLRRYINDELQRIRDAFDGVIDGAAVSFLLEVSKGTVQGHKTINKFGRNTDIDTIEEDVWDGGGIYNYSTTADITHIVSSSASDTMEIEIDGLDANWEEVTQTKTLTGTTAVALDTPLIREPRMKNNSGTAAVGVIQSGVGTTTGSFSAANLRAQISLGYEQTLMAIYTVPAGKTGYMTNFWGDINKSNTTGALDMTLWKRDFGGVFRVQNTVGLLTAGTSHFQHEYAPYPKIEAKADIKITGIGSTVNFDVSAGFDLILVDDGF